MCLIIAKPKGSTITTHHRDKFTDLFRSFSSTNSDGWGIMYKRNGQKEVNLAKGIFKQENLHLKGTPWDVNSIEEFVDVLMAQKFTKNDEVAIHFRIRTSGLTNSTNCHPFYISNREVDINKCFGKHQIAAIAHNGCFPAFTEFGLPFSDTYYYTKYFLSLKGVLKLIFKNRESTDAKTVVAQSSRVVIIDPKRDMYIAGHGWTKSFNDDLWFSSSYSANRYDDIFKQYRDTSSDSALVPLNKLIITEPITM